MKRLLFACLLLGGCDAILDFDELRHGHADMRVVNDGDMRVADGGGAGTCLAPQTGPFFDYASPSETNLGQFAYALALADVDADGRLDIVTLEGDNQLRAYSVSAARAVKAIWTKPTGCAALGANDALAAGDLNGDHLLDLVAACAGTGSTPQGNLDLLRGSAPGQLAVAQPFATQPSNPFTTITPDIDGDGSSDLVVVDTKDPASVDVYWGVAPGGDVVGGAPLRVTVSAGSTPIGILAAPLGGDGVLDLLVLTINGEMGQVEIFRRDRSPDNARHFVSGSDIVSIPEGEPTTFGIGNLDSDTRPDLLVAVSGGTLYVAPGTSGADGVTTYATPSIDVTTPLYALALAVGDLNCDGLDDVVLTHDPSLQETDADTYEVWTSGGDTLMPAPGGGGANIVMDGEPNTSFVQIADIDGDGLPDIVMTVDDRDDSMQFSRIRILFGQPHA